MTAMASIVEPYDFSALSIDPPADLAVRSAAALPELGEPAALPVVTSPSAEGLVAVSCVPGVVDVRAYAAAGVPGSPAASLVREGLAEALASAARRVALDGFTLAVYDAWRPLAVQQHLYDVAYLAPDLPPGFVTPPTTDPLTPPPHLTGGTVDVTLALEGQPLALGTAFDDFSHLAHTRALEATAHPARELRRLLFWSMRDAGFVVLDCEWWHFELGTRRWAAITSQAPRYAGADPRA